MNSSTTILERRVSERRNAGEEKREKKMERDSRSEECRAMFEGKGRDGPDTSRSVERSLPSTVYNGRRRNYGFRERRELLFERIS